MCGYECPASCFDAFVKRQLQAGRIRRLWFLLSYLASQFVRTCLTRQPCNPFLEPSVRKNLAILETDGFTRASAVDHCKERSFYHFFGVIRQAVPIPFTNHGLCEFKLRTASRCTAQSPVSTDGISVRQALI